MIRQADKIIELEGLVSNYAGGVYFRPGGSDDEDSDDSDSQLLDAASEAPALKNFVPTPGNIYVDQMLQVAPDFGSIYDILMLEQVFVAFTQEVMVMVMLVRWLTKSFSSSIRRRSWRRSCGCLPQCRRDEVRLFRGLA